MIILAQASPSPIELAGWLGCLVAFIAGVNQVLKLTDRFRSKPPTEQLEASQKTFVERLQRSEREIEVLQENLERHRHENEVHASKRSATIFAQIEATRKELSGDIKKLETEMSQLPDRILKVLSDIKNLGDKS